MRTADATNLLQHELTGPSAPAGGAAVQLQSIDALLKLIFEGIEARRQLDGDSLNDPKLARARLRQLETLQELKGQVLAKLAAPGALNAAAGAVEAHVRAILESADRRISFALTRTELDGRARLNALERQRTDFVWAALLIDWLGDESFRDPALAIRADIDRLKRQLGSCADTSDVAGFLRLDRTFDALRRQTLRLRAAREIAGAEGTREPDSCWNRRLTMSRLRAEISLGSEASSINDAEQAALSDSIANLDRERDQLADRADKLLQELGPTAMPAAWKAVVTVAEGDANEVAAYLQDAELPKAIAVLEIALQDAARLQATARQIVAPEHDRPATQKVAVANRMVNRLQRQTRAQLQDKRLARRLETALGRSAAAWLERIVLLLVFAMVAAIGLEAYLEARYDLPHSAHESFAWLELGLCTVFLSEFFLKLWLSDDRRLYFRRHVLVDFVASIPFGFFAHHLQKAEFTAYENLPQLLRLLRLLRLPALAMYLQAFRPFLRLIRLAAFALKASDHLVQRHSRLFNQNVILFEPEIRDETESEVRHHYRRLHGIWQRRRDEIYGRLESAQRLEAIEGELADLEIRLLRPLPMPENRASGIVLPARSIRVEVVVRRLTEMTPERLIDAGGQGFADSVHRLIRLFDVPLIRRLPMIRRLVAHREKGSAEAAALVANYAGHSIQRLVDFSYYLADLHGTISGPIFLDRLGATIVKTTAGPAKRLASLGLSLLLLYAIVKLLGFQGLFRRFFDKTYDVLAGPITILGLGCAVPLVLGIWFRRIANQASEYCERIVEAQFANQTKNIKASHRGTDERFLNERVLAPETELRGVDDRVSSGAEPEVPAPGNGVVGQLLRRDESLFLRSVDMLYRDYLDGALFHRTDTKTTNQLLGNLALTNLRLSNLEHVLRESKQLRSLDLSRAGSVFGGPYLWFNYINRIITQQTAQLIVDYNTHAIPMTRLECSPPESRQAFDRWLAGRLDGSAASLQAPTGEGRKPRPPNGTVSNRSRDVQFFESVDFTAIDFLSTDEQREQELAGRFGQKLIELLRQDRANVVRFAFRSFPLHRVPLPERTINPYLLYEKYVANGRVAVLPFVLIVRGCRLAAHGLGLTVAAIRRVLNPEVSRQSDPGPESYAVARRKINRMRKPVFMRTLWLRARFDVEYVGLALPSMPLDVGRIPPMERDLEFIGASRRDRNAAEKLRRSQREKLRWIGRWFGERKFDFDTLPELLDRRFPFLSFRTAEVVRALVTACIVDHDDLFSLAASIEGLRRCCQHALSKPQEVAGLPENLPPVVEREHPLWYRIRRNRRPSLELFDRKGFDRFDGVQREKIVRYLRRHQAAVQGWYDVVLGEGNGDPWATWDRRAFEVVLRTELWSDQMVALRTVQSLALLDLHHYCELVWRLGGYEASESRPFDAVLPFDSPV